MWVEKRSNGTYKAIERYTDYLTGKDRRVSVTMEKNTAQSRKQAQIALNEKIQKAYSGKKEEKKVTLKELIEEYRKYQKGTVKESTYRRNYYACEPLKVILGDDVLANRLNARYVREKFLSTEESPGRLNERMKRFKALIRWGYHNDMIGDISFLDKLEPFKDISHREKIQDKFLEADELRMLLAEMKKEQWMLFTKFLALSGLRCGEAIALLMSDLDFKERVIHVNKTYDCNNKLVSTTKTLCSTREVYMQEDLMDLCRQIKIATLQNNLLCGHPESKLLFSNSCGEFVSYAAYNGYLKKYSLKVLGRSITPHTLRHTHASLMFEQGLTIDEIARRLGHDDSKVTREIYLHITEKLKERDRERIKNLRII